MAAAELGDERLRRRLVAIADAAESAPASSFPRMTNSDGELEGIYRFLSNERVTAQNILSPHVATTLSRARIVDEVLVIHDTTLFNFGGSSTRQGLGWLHKEDGSQGFLGHFSLAVSGDGSRRPLGLVGLSTIVREGKPVGRSVTQRSHLPNKESDRWLESTLEVHAALPHAIHVTDREGDMFYYFKGLNEAGADFVTRMREKGSRVAVEGGLRIPVAELAAKQPVRLVREVMLSPRKASSLEVKNRLHPPRDRRSATLEVRAIRVVLPTPTTRTRSSRAPVTEINVVAVVEVGVAPGIEPVVWQLATSLPIDTEAQLERIVDIYRARWVIEEYFKALKTGCSFEKRQLESFHALLNALAVFAVVAWRLLLLRTMARDEPNAAANSAITRRQEALLRALARLDDSRFKRIKMPTSATATDALMAVAGLGGHLKNNGFPGWQVIGRGYDALLLLELGWRARDTM